MPLSYSIRDDSVCRRIDFKVTTKKTCINGKSLQRALNCRHANRPARGGPGESPVGIQLNVIYLEVRVFQALFDKIIRNPVFMAGPGGTGGQGHVSLRSIVPVECKRRTSGPDCLSAASFRAARRACYRHLTAWRVASATCSTHVGYNESHSVRTAESPWNGLYSQIKEC